MQKRQSMQICKYGDFEAIHDANFRGVELYERERERETNVLFKIINCPDIRMHI